MEEYNYLLKIPALADQRKTPEYNVLHLTSIGEKMYILTFNILKKNFFILQTFKYVNIIADK